MIKITPPPDIMRYKKRFAELRRLKLYVGVPSGSAGRLDPEEKKQGQLLTNADIAYLQEFGTAKIPARPFLVPTIRQEMPKILKILRPVLGDLEHANPMVQAGLYAQAQVRNTIKAGLTPPLSPVTIKMRQMRRKSGKAGTKPLIDTGNLLKSIDFVVTEEDLK